MRAGFIAVGGRPNVGKSTLFNQLLGNKKLSIVSRRRQTTRYCIRGILTEKNAQYIFIDTPGWQQKDGGHMNKSLNAAAAQTLPFADVALLVLAGRHLHADDRRIAKMFPQELPVIAVLNKVDLLDQQELLPLAKELAQWRDFAAIMPASALKGTNVAQIKKQLYKHLPPGDAIYPATQITDKDERFFLADLIREQAFNKLGAELPYHVAVIITHFAKGPKGITHIHADIVVDTKSRKAMVIGKGGSMLKRIGSAARPGLEEFLGSKVFVKLFVRVKPHWTTSTTELTRLGIQL